MKFREDPRTRHIDWESLSWVKSFRGNVPPFKKTEAVLEDVEPRDGGLRILAKVAGLDLTVIIPPRTRLTGQTLQPGSGSTEEGCSGIYTRKSWICPERSDPELARNESSARAWAENRAVASPWQRALRAHSGEND